MDFLQLATQRYSVRSFSNRPIESEKMDRILKAGQVAPTAINFRSQKIDILKGGSLYLFILNTRLTRTDKKE